MVRYDPDEVDRFIALADSVEDALPQVMVDGEEASPDSPSGLFEVVAEDGSLIYSAQQSGGFPDPDDIIRLLRQGGGPAAQR